MSVFVLRLVLIIIGLSSCSVLGAQRTEGKASYYADRLHARTTSTGEAYHRDSLTAASRDYPFNTVLEVTNVVNGQQVLVRVNDCGPHREDRIIDLSKAAARRIGLLRSGTARVSLRVVSLGEDGPTCERTAWAATERIRQENQQADTEIDPDLPTATTSKGAVGAAAPPAPPLASDVPPAAPPKATRRAADRAPRGVRNYESEDLLFGVQVGAFRQQANAEELVDRLTNLGFAEVWSAKMGKVYRVYTGKYYFQDEAEELKELVREAGFRDASVRRVQ